MLVSDISYGEVAVKAAKGKLTLSVDVAIWMQQAEQASGIRFRALDRPVLLLSTRLHVRRGLVAPGSEDSGQSRTRER